MRRTAPPSGSRLYNPSKPPTSLGAPTRTVPSAAPPSSSAPTSGAGGTSRRRRRPRGDGLKNSSSSSRHTTLLWLVVIVMGLLVLADLAYLVGIVYPSASSTTKMTTLSSMDAQHEADYVNLGQQDHQLPRLQQQQQQQQQQQEEEDDPQKQQHEDDDPSSPRNQKSPHKKVGTDIRADKGPILHILQQAKIKIDDLDDETIAALPTWTQIVDLFGDHPQIHGLETCDGFRNSTDPKLRFVGIAGTFNSGTNLLAELMIQNCQITERMKAVGRPSKGMRWQVPWGKHLPATDRGKHETSTDHDVPYVNSLPLVTIRDPYEWSQSMCRHQYAAFWDHTKTHCPNLVPTKQDTRKFPQLKGQSLVPVRIEYPNEFKTHHDSLAHFYNDWYRTYYHADFPRIMVRFEDLLFHGQAVTETLCQCVGGEPRDDHPRGFEHISTSAKLGTAAHGKHKTGLVGALIKYGNHEHRLDQMTMEDIEAMKTILDPEIMKTFAYSHPTEMQ